MCNGHAEECTQTESGLMACHCQDNTCGEQCQSCCDGYVLKDGVCVGKLLESRRVSSPIVFCSRPRLSMNSIRNVY